MPQNAELLEKLIESCDAIVYLKDEEGRFLFVNRAFEEAFQLEAGEAIGQDDFLIGSKEQADAWRSLDDQVRTTGQPATAESTVAVPSGEKTLLDHKFAVSGIEGAPRAVGGIAIEVPAGAQPA